MQTFCKIIVEQSNGRWSAWFRDVPNIAIRGAWPVDAIQQLIWHFGEEQFDTEQIIALDDDARDDHREFMIRLLHQRRIPIPLTSTDRLSMIESSTPAKDPRLISFV